MPEESLSGWTLLMSGDSRAIGPAIAVGAARERKRPCPRTIPLTTTTHTSWIMPAAQRGKTAHRRPVLVESFIFENRRFMVGGCSAPTESTTSIGNDVGHDLAKPAKLRTPRWSF
jgi:hypothetical protein